MDTCLPTNATLIGRAWVPGAGPCVVSVRRNEVVDLTSRITPTVRDVCEMDDPVGYVRTSKGTTLGDLSCITSQSIERSGREDVVHLLAPCDLQVIKACGVTFAGSMVERVIEEKAAGDAAKADSIRQRIGAKIGQKLSNIIPGSTHAGEVKSALIEEGLWSQYLEVGIGPDAEVFTKCPVLAAVGYGSRIGIHPSSTWNNPEPELVLAVNSKGHIAGVSLGNDVNLRDFEGRSALLLGKSKDNNASTAIGPFIRLFDDTFSLDDAKKLTIELHVSGSDGFDLADHHQMQHISRDLEDLVGQTLNQNHTYPDGLMLFCGTAFTPVDDRDEPGAGFTHRIGDVVSISTQSIGLLTNTIAYCNDCERWNFSASHLMRNLAGRRMI